MTTYASDLEAIRAAAQRIAGAAHQTPVHTSRTIDAMCGAHLYFKCEQYQRVGAFKFRGAMNAVSRQFEAGYRGAIVTHSSGNHAQAVALAAKLHDLPAHIVMPTNAPRIKRTAVEGYGATVHSCAPTLVEREATAARICQETGGILIPPYDHPDVIGGQGTAGLELFEQVPQLDAIVVPVGGGGLLSGVTLAYRELAPTVPVFAAEPLGADDAAQSKRSGSLIPQTNPQTVADGLRTSLGHHTWPVVRDLVSSVIVVDDHEIVAAMRLLWERMKLLVEPSAAVGLAAILSRQEQTLAQCKHIGVLLTGGNLDLGKLPWS
jgi:threonine dehydratase